MEQHVTVVGALTIGLGVFGILIGLFLFTLLAGIGFLAEDEEASVVLVAVGSFLAIFLLILSVPGIIGGIGLFKRKEWARILVLVLSVLHLVNIPIGTGIGIYSIWVLVQKETVLLFNPIVPPAPGQPI
ncbi:MAG TPA: hypothetical protein DEP53_17540 [Bacteroidetes bacterium]|nr:hypothetical protein [Bacteroidota bacterium]